MSKTKTKSEVIFDRLPQHIKESEVLSLTSKKVLAGLLELQLHSQGKETGIIYANNTDLRAVSFVKMNNLLDGIRELEDHKFVFRKQGTSKGNASEYIIDFDALEDDVKEATFKDLFGGIAAMARNRIDQLKGHTQPIPKGNQPIPNPIPKAIPQRVQPITQPIPKTSGNPLGTTITITRPISNTNTISNTIPNLISKSSSIKNTNTMTSTNSNPMEIEVLIEKIQKIVDNSIERMIPVMVDRIVEELIGRGVEMKKNNTEVSTLGKVETSMNEKAVCKVESPSIEKRKEVNENIIKPSTLDEVEGNGEDKTINPSSPTDVNGIATPLPMEADENKQYLSINSKLSSCYAHLRNVVSMDAANRVIEDMKKIMEKEDLSNRVIDRIEVKVQGILQRNPMLNYYFNPKGEIQKSSTIAPNPSNGTTVSPMGENAAEPLETASNEKSCNPTEVKKLSRAEQEKKVRVVLQNSKLMYKGLQARRDNFEFFLNSLRKSNIDEDLLEYFTNEYLEDNDSKPSSPKDVNGEATPLPMEKENYAKASTLDEVEADMKDNNPSSEEDGIATTIPTEAQETALEPSNDSTLTVTNPSGDNAAEPLETASNEDYDSPTEDDSSNPFKVEHYKGGIPMPPKVNISTTVETEDFLRRAIDEVAVRL